MGLDRVLAGELRACICGKAKMNAKAGPPEVSASEPRWESQAKGRETGTLVHCPLAPCCQQPWAQRVIKSPARPAEHPFLCQSVQPGPPEPRGLPEERVQSRPSLCSSLGWAAAPRALHGMKSHPSPRISDACRVPQLPSTGLGGAQSCPVGVSQQPAPPLDMQGPQGCSCPEPPRTADLPRPRQLPRGWVARQVPRPCSESQMRAVGAGLPRSNLPVCLGPRAAQQRQHLCKDGPGAPPRTTPRLPLLRVSEGAWGQFTVKA